MVPLHDQRSLELTLTLLTDKNENFINLTVLAAAAAKKINI